MHPQPPLIHSRHLPDEDATSAFGRILSRVAVPGETVFLQGGLGAGKTTLVRALLGALGWAGLVRSPSYSLVHSYRFETFSVHHLDLYRLGGLDEALGLDLDELLAPDALVLLEWPDRLEGGIRPDWIVELIHREDGRDIRVSGPVRAKSILAAPYQEIRP